MHITPFTYLWCTYDIVVGNIHSSRICNLSIDDNYLTMIAWPDMVHPGKTDRVELHNVDTIGMELAEVFLLKGLIVGVVSETIKHCPYLNSFLTLLSEKVEQKGGDRVIAEIEIL